MPGPRNFWGKLVWVAGEEGCQFLGIHGHPRGRDDFLLADKYPKKGLEVWGGREDSQVVHRGWLHARGTETQGSVFCGFVPQYRACGAGVPWALGCWTVQEKAPWTALAE